MVVITGATGFVGRSVTALIESIGVAVRPVSRRHVAGMLHVEDYSDAPSGDVLIHLAEGSDRGDVNQLGESYIARAAGVLRALACRRDQRIIYASSSVVYGDEHESPCRTDTPVVAADVYSRSKLFNEQIVLDSGGTVLRLSNLFGAGMATGNVMSDILRQIRAAGAIHVRDDKPVRDFLHVSDAAAAFSLLLEHRHNGILNVGSGIGTSVRALSELILASAGQQGRPIVASAPSARRSINVLDISGTTSLLGWLPRVSLEAHLARLSS